MNKKTRNRLNKILSQIQDLKEEIQVIENEEQEKFDNLPEGLQGSEMGESMEAAINALSECADHLDSAEESLMEIE